MKAISGFPHAACRCYRPSEHAGTPGKARSCKYHRPAANLGQKGGHPVDVGLNPREEDVVHVGTMGKAISLRVLSLLA
jgi:hypothetical protein